MKICMYIFGPIGARVQGFFLLQILFVHNVMVFLLQIFFVSMGGSTKNNAIFMGKGLENMPTKNIATLCGEKVLEPTKNNAILCGKRVLQYFSLADPLAFF